MRRAWYLGHGREELGDAAILVGDPDRVDRIAALLDEPVHLPVKRGLRTVTGRRDGARISVAAFGMGAPIATIVLHELADLGLARFLRIGTAMHFPPAEAGRLLISETGLAFDGTSPAYGPVDAPIPADPGLVAALAAAAEARRHPALCGPFATFDAFYRDMYGLDAPGRARAEATRARLAEKGALASDMETAALLAAARALGVAAATLCLGTVDGLTQEKLAPGSLAEGEALMFAVALNALTGRPT